MTHLITNNMFYAWWLLWKLQKENEHFFELQNPSFCCYIGYTCHLHFGLNLNVIYYSFLDL